jgi:hypothetical protein
MSSLYPTPPPPHPDDPTPIPSLQEVAVKSLLNTANVHPDFDIVSQLLTIQGACLPTSIADSLLHDLARINILTKPLISILLSFELDTVDFAGLEFDTVEDDLFDELLFSAKRLILDNVYMESCFFRMFVIASLRVVSSAGVGVVSAAPRMRTSVEPPSADYSHLLHLHVNNCNSLTDEFVSYFSNAFPYLESLLISDCEQLSEEAVVCIATAPFAQTLKALDISYNVATADCLSYLTNLVAIEQLNLSNIKCSSSFRFIVSSPHLRELWLSSVYVLTDDDIRYILSGGHMPGNSVFKKLTDLHMTESVISSQCLQDLVQENCPGENDMFNLRKLDLSWTNENLTESAIKLLISKCRNLISLKLLSTDSGEETFQEIASTCLQLEVLHFSRCASQPLRLQALTSLTHLIDLHLGWAVFSPEEILGYVENCEATAALKEVLCV